MEGTPLRRVVKVGTSLLRGSTARSTAAVITDLAAAMARAQARGEQLALVTSGAVGLGCRLVGGLRVRSFWSFASRLAEPS